MTKCIPGSEEGKGSWCRSLFKEGIDRILMQSRFEEIL